MKKKLLFVDDERNVLEGLHRMLHGLRGEWEMQFALSGQQALALMAKQDFDVIVSDLLMPGMSGAQLLQEVMTRHPDTIRVVLSGHVDDQLSMRALGVTHQYLSKPCTPELLKSTVVRAT